MNACLDQGETPFLSFWIWSCKWARSWITWSCQAIKLMPTTMSILWLAIHIPHLHQKKSRHRRSIGSTVRLGGFTYGLALGCGTDCPTQCRWYARLKFCLVPPYTRASGTVQKKLWRQTQSITKSSCHIIRSSFIGVRLPRAYSRP